MFARFATPLALLALTLPFAACGESEKDKYIGDFRPLNDELLAVGGNLATALDGVESKSDAALAKQFGALATRLEDVRKQIAALDTPADLKDESKALTDKLGATTSDVEKIAEAARENDAQAAAAATVQLSSDAADVNKAQNKLARATGADVGGR